MTEYGTRTARDDRSHPTPVIGGMGSAYCVYAVVKRMKSPRLDSVVDRLGGVANPAQLLAGNDPVLIFSQIPCLPRHPSPLRPPLIGRLVN
jgi:hypothetical protein